jgi:hypothetical protein
VFEIDRTRKAQEQMEAMLRGSGTQQRRGTPNFFYCHGQRYDACCSLSANYRAD